VRSSTALLTGQRRGRLVVGFGIKRGQLGSRVKRVAGERVDRLLVTHLEQATPLAQQER